MISIETMKFRTADMIGEEFPLTFWRGKGRIVASNDTSLSLLVRGVRFDLTWDRLAVTWNRPLSNHTLTVDELCGEATAEPPALIKGYLRCGAKLLGPPAWDPDFGTADLPMLLDLADLPAAYRRRFLGH